MIMGFGKVPVKTNNTENIIIFCMGMYRKYDYILYGKYSYHSGIIGLGFFDIHVTLCRFSVMETYTLSQSN